MPTPKTPHRARSALTLLEVLLAGLVLSLAIIPAIGLMSSSSAEIAKVRSRVIAVNLAASMTEDMRMRPPPARAAYGPRRADQLTHLLPIVQAYRTSGPPAASRANVERLLGSFAECRMTLGTAVPLSPPSSSIPSVRARVRWTVAGRPYDLTSDAWIGSSSP